MCLASHNNHPTSFASSWDIWFLKNLVQQDPKGSNKVAHLFIFDVYVSPNRKYVNLPLIYYILYFSFFMSQDDAYFHIHQNDPWDIYSHFWSTCTGTLYCITQSLNFEATLTLICPVQCCIHILVTTFCIWMDIQLSFEVWIIWKIWEYFRPVTDLSSQSRGQKTSLLLSKFRQKFCWD